MIKEMMGSDRLIKWSNIHVLSGNGWEYFENLGALVVLFLFWFFSFITMAVVNCHGAWGCHLMWDTKGSRACFHLGSLS
jgi:hypothetical protein